MIGILSLKFWRGFTSATICGSVFSGPGSTSPFDELIGCSGVKPGSTFDFEGFPIADGFGTTINGFEMFWCPSEGGFVGECGRTGGPAKTYG
jgi:hypothetical protein